LLFKREPVSGGNPFRSELDSAATFRLHRLDAPHTQAYDSAVNCGQYSSIYSPFG
jgi:hypothetical protein